MTRYILSLLIVLFSLGSFAQSEYDFELSKGLDIYAELLQKLNLHYVDPLEPGTLNQTAIEAMLKQLDPYTIYYPESQMEDVAFMHSGKYGGIGASLLIRNDSVFVNRVLKGYSFDKEGIKSGDLLLKIDKIDLMGKTQQEMSELLQGSAGSKFELSYYRPTGKKSNKTTITREEVQIDNVSYSALVEDGIAYVKLEQFKKDAGLHIKQALDSLSKQGSLKGVVIDLRSNPGGLLIEAVNIIDLFVGPGQEVVSTRGKVKQQNRVYKTAQNPTYPDVKVAVLVNGRSASASEIVAGGLQDLDRAVIIGQKSFGKGLVQNVMPLSYRAQVKITTAKYYIPSGRCIQAIDYSHKKNGKAERIPDSLYATFYTKAGRPVKDAGGVVPDVKMPAPAYSDITMQLLNHYHIYDFCNTYQYNAAQDTYGKQINPNLMQAFKDYLAEQNFRYESEAYTNWKALSESCSGMDNKEGISNALQVIEQKIILDGEQEFAKHEQEIYQLLVSELESRLRYQKGKVKSDLRFDPELDKAIEILTNQAQYNSLLQVTK